MFTNITHGYQALGISEDMENLDLAKYVLGGSLRMVITIDEGVTVGMAHAIDEGGTFGFQPPHLWIPPVPTIGAIFSSTPTDPDTSRLILRNSGTIRGMNGMGGDSEWGETTVDGRPGYPAIYLPGYVDIWNYGTIHAGGGGGGASADQGLGSDGLGGTGWAGGKGDFGMFWKSVKYGAATGTNDKGFFAGGCGGPGLPGEAGTGGRGGKYLGTGGRGGYSTDTNGYSSRVVVHAGSSGIVGGTN